MALSPSIIRVSSLTFLTFLLADGEAALLRVLPREHSQKRSLVSGPLRVSSLPNAWRKFSRNIKVFGGFMRFLMILYSTLYKLFTLSKKANSFYFYGELLELRITK